MDASWLALLWLATPGTETVIDTEEAGRVAYVQFSDVSGETAVDWVVDGLSEGLGSEFHIPLVRRDACAADSMVALDCLKEGDPSIGAVVQLGTAAAAGGRVVATVDCAVGDRLERLVGGPFRVEEAGWRWGRDVLAAALVDRLRTCAQLPASLTTSDFLPDGTRVQLDGRPVVTLQDSSLLRLTSLKQGRRQLTFQRDRWEFEPTSFDAKPGETTSVSVEGRRIVYRPRWAMLTYSALLAGGGAALFAVRANQRSDGACVTFGDAFDSSGCDDATDARFEDAFEYGIPSTMLVTAGVVTAATEFILPRRKPWWIVVLAGAAAAPISAIPWLL